MSCVLRLLTNAACRAPTVIDTDSLHGPKTPPADWILSEVGQEAIGGLGAGVQRELITNVYICVGKRTGSRAGRSQHPGEK